MRVSKCNCLRSCFTCSCCTPVPDDGIRQLVQIERNVNKALEELAHGKSSHKKFAIPANFRAQKGDLQKETKNSKTDFAKFDLNVQNGHHTTKDRTIFGKLEHLDGLDNMIATKDGKLLTYSSNDIYITNSLNDGVNITQHIFDNEFSQDKLEIKSILYHPYKNTVIALHSTGLVNISDTSKTNIQLEELKHNSNYVYFGFESSSTEARELGLNEYLPPRLELLVSSPRGDYTLFSFSSLLLNGKEIGEFTLKVDDYQIGRIPKDKDNNELLLERYLPSRQSVCHLYANNGSLRIQVTKIILIDDGSKAMFDVPQVYTMPVKVNLQLVAGSRCLEGQLLHLVSEDHTTLYQFDLGKPFYSSTNSVEKSIALVGGSTAISEIVHFRGRVKKVRYISSQQNARFILANVNEGELIVWALLNNKYYGEIFSARLHAPEASIFMTPNCSHIIEVKKNMVYAIEFGAEPQEPIVAVQFNPSLRTEETNEEIICVKLLPCMTMFSLVMTNKRLFLEYAVTSKDSKNCVHDLCRIPQHWKLEPTFSIYLTDGEIDSLLKNYQTKEDAGTYFIVQQVYDTINDYSFYWVSAITRIQRDVNSLVSEIVKPCFKHIGWFWTVSASQYCMYDKDFYILDPKKSRITVMKDIKDYLENPNMTRIEYLEKNSVYVPAISNGIGIQVFNFLDQRQTVLEGDLGSIKMSKILVPESKLTYQESVYCILFDSTKASQEAQDRASLALENGSRIAAELSIDNNLEKLMDRPGTGGNSLKLNPDRIFEQIHGQGLDLGEEEPLNVSPSTKKSGNRVLPAFRPKFPILKAGKDDSFYSRNKIPSSLPGYSPSIANKIPPPLTNSQRWKERLPRIDSHREKSKEVKEDRDGSEEVDDDDFESDLDEIDEGPIVVTLGDKDYCKQARVTRTRQNDARSEYNYGAQSTLESEYNIGKLDERTAQKRIRYVQNLNSRNTVDDNEDDDVSFMEEEVEEAKAYIPLTPLRKFACIFKLSYSVSDGIGSQGLTKVGEFDLGTEMQFCKISSKGRYCVFGGERGYELFEMTTSNSDKLVMTSIRYRWRDPYKISRADAMEFSMDEKYLVLALESSKKVQLLSLEEVRITWEKLRTNKRQVGDYALAIDLDTPDDYSYNLPSIFKFQETQDRHFLFYYKVNKGRGHNSINIFDLDKKAWILFFPVFSTMIPVHSTILNERSSSFKVLVVLKSLEDKNFKGFKLFTSSEITSQIPNYTILRRSMINYFTATPGAQQSYYEGLLVNTFKIMDEELIAQDPRIAFCLFFMDKSGLFQDVFSSQKIDINRLLSSMSILHLVFSPLSEGYTKSLSSLGTMFEEYIDSKRFPNIDEHRISTLMASSSEQLVLSNTSRKIMSNILFSSCDIKVTGLTKSKLIGLVPLNTKENKAKNLSETLIKKKAYEVMMERPHQVNEYEVYRTRVELDLTNGSDHSIGLMNVILTMSDDEIRYKYRQIINYKWNMIWGVSFAYTMLYYVFNALAYVYFGYNSDPTIGIIIVIFNVLFIACDIKCAGSEVRTYFKDPINLIDPLVHAFSIVAVVVTWISVFEVVTNYFKLLAIILISLRGIVHLKLFGPLRILVSMLVEILYDLRYLVVLFIGILLLAATVYKVTPLPGGENRENLSFLEALQRVSILMFMTSKADPSEVADRSSTAGTVRSIMMVLTSTIAAQGIFNLIIAVFLQTFKKVNADRGVYELRSLVLEIQYFDMLAKGFSVFTKPRKGYFIIFVPVPKEGLIYENESMLEKVTSMFDTVLVEVGKKGLEKVGEKVKKIMPAQASKIDDAVEGLNQNAKVDPTIAKLISFVESVKKGIPPTQEQLTSVAAVITTRLVSSEAKVYMERAVDSANKLNQLPDLDLTDPKKYLWSQIESTIDIYSMMFPNATILKSLNPNRLKDLLKAIHSMLYESKTLDDQLLQVKELLKAVDLLINLSTDETAKKNSVKITDSIKSVVDVVRHFNKKESSTEDLLILASQMFKELKIEEVSKLIDDKDQRQKISGVLDLVIKVTPLLKQDDSTHLNLDAIIDACESSAKKLVKEEKFVSTLFSTIRVIRKLELNGEINENNLTSVIDIGFQVSELAMPSRTVAIRKANTLCHTVVKQVVKARGNESVDITELLDDISGIVSGNSQKASSVLSACKETIKLVKSVQSLTEGANNYSEVIDRASEAIVIIDKAAFKDSHSAGIKKAVGLIKPVIKAIEAEINSNESPNAFRVIESSMDILGGIEPHLKPRIEQLRTLMEILTRQIKNMSSSNPPDRDLIIVDSLTVVKLVYPNEEFSKRLDIISSAVKVALDNRSQLSNIGTAGSTEAFMELVVQLSELSTKIMPNNALAIESASIVNNTAKLVSAVIQGTTSGNGMQIDVAIKAMVDIARIKYKNERSTAVLNSIESMGKGFQSGLEIFTTANDLDRVDHALKMIETLTDPISALYPPIIKTKPLVLKAVEIIRMTTHNDGNAHDKLVSLIENVGELVVLVKPDYRVNVEKVLQVFRSMTAEVSDLRKGIRVSATQVARSVKTIVQAFDDKYSAPASDICDLVEAIEQLANRGGSTTEILSGISSLSEPLSKMVPECQTVIQTIGLVSQIAKEKSTKDGPLQEGDIKICFKAMRALLEKLNINYGDVLTTTEELINITLSIYESTLNRDKNQLPDLNLIVEASAKVIMKIKPSLSRELTLAVYSSAVLQDIVSTCILKEKNSKFDFPKLVDNLGSITVMVDPSLGDVVARATKIVNTLYNDTKSLSICRYSEGIVITALEAVEHVLEATHTENSEIGQKVSMGLKIARALWDFNYETQDVLGLSIKITQAIKVLYPETTEILTNVEALQTAGFEAVKLGQSETKMDLVKLAGLTKTISSRIFESYVSLKGSKQKTEAGKLMSSVERCIDQGLSAFKIIEEALKMKEGQKPFVDTVDYVCESIKTFYPERSSELDSIKAVVRAIDVLAANNGSSKRGLLGSLQSMDMLLANKSSMKDNIVSTFRAAGQAISALEPAYAEKMEIVESLVVSMVNISESGKIKPEDLISLSRELKSLIGRFEPRYALEADSICRMIELISTQAEAIRAKHPLNVISLISSTLEIIKFLNPTVGPYINSLTPLLATTDQILSKSKENKLSASEIVKAFSQLVSLFDTQTFSDDKLQAILSVFTDIAEVVDTKSINMERFKALLDKFEKLLPIASTGPLNAVRELLNKLNKNNVGAGQEEYLVSSSKEGKTDTIAKIVIDLAQDQGSVNRFKAILL